MHRPTLGRPLSAVLAAGALAALSVAGAGAASAAPAVSTQDQQFLMANQQTNLAELTIDPLAEQKTQNAMSLDLAHTSMTDHTTAKNLAAQVAQQLGVTLPTAPNATQRAQAAQLTAASAANFDRLFAQVQLAGHQLSIASTEKEISSGSNAQVVQYAKTYLPLAQKHLQMAQAEVRSLGGSTAVAAGSGGTAATSGSDPRSWELGLGAGVVLAAAGAVALGRGRLARR